MQEIATREVELKGITNHLLPARTTSIDDRLRDIRQFVEKGISDLRGLLNRDAALAKTELRSHLSEMGMTPAERREEWHYVAEGTGEIALHANTRGTTRPNEISAGRELL